jgi:hypothetical protein
MASCLLCRHILSLEPCCQLSYTFLHFLWQCVRLLVAIHAYQHLSLLVFNFRPSDRCEGFNFTSTWLTRLSIFSCAWWLLEYPLRKGPIRFWPFRRSELAKDKIRANLVDLGWLCCVSLGPGTLLHSISRIVFQWAQWGGWVYGQRKVKEAKLRNW